MNNVWCVLWFVSAVPAMIIQAKHLKRFQRALVLKYPHATLRNKLQPSHYVLLFLYVASGPMAWLVLAADEKKSIVGTKLWEKAK